MPSTNDEKDGQLITVWLMHDQATLPVPVVATATMTPAQLHRAELELDPNRPQLRDHQLLQLATHLSQARDCSFLRAENGPPMIPMPCLRREALWQQQA